METVAKMDEKMSSKLPKCPTQGCSSALGCCTRHSCGSLTASEGSSKDGGGGGGVPPPNNNVYHLDNRQLKEFTFPKRKPVDIEFKNIKFSVHDYNITKLQKTTREILHGVDGKFKSGKLTAIMGPSGAGKSTLLNILAGLTSKGVSGDVLVNGRVRNVNTPGFKRLSRYIQQDDDLRPYLTTGEAMTVAANLKLGYTLTHTQKHEQIMETLAMLGLEETYNTMTGRLSGGQRKRLSVALELLSNPPILFLDEPTTGLDSSSCSQCVSLLKRLSQEGRTIICTIHQPTALLFDMFDDLYALADGYSIYRGQAKYLVPFLGSQGLICPPFHNPADYLIEVAIGEHNVDLEKLAEAACKIDEECTTISRYSDNSEPHEMEMHSLLATETCNTSTKTSSTSDCSEDSANLVEHIYPPPSQLQQFLLLLKRNFVTASRDYSLMIYRLLAHILIGFLFGYLYHNVGNNADTVLANYVYLYGTLLLVVYTGKMSVTLQFPLEMEILKREHFNRWYKLAPYIFANLAVEVPFQIICCCSYVGISYIMTGNLLVNYRIFYFFIIIIATSLCGQSWGYFIGATTPVKIAVFIGPVLAVLFSVFGFCIRLTDTPYFFKWLFHASYFRAGFHSLVYSVYGLSRDKLDCFGDGFKYCHYKTPEKFLREMDIIDINIWTNLGLVFGLGIVMHIATAGALWCRLNRR